MKMPYREILDTPPDFLDDIVEELKGNAHVIVDVLAQATGLRVTELSTNGWITALILKAWESSTAERGNHLCFHKYWISEYISPKLSGKHTYATPFPGQHRLVH